MSKNLLVIDKAMWVNGGNNHEQNAHEYYKGPSMMLNPQGNMCCLGFQAQQSGVDEDHLNCGTPEDVAYSCGKVYDERFVQKNIDLEFENTKLSGELMEINDDPNLTYKNRVDRLRRKFKKAGITLKIVDSSKKKNG